MPTLLELQTERKTLIEEGRKYVSKAEAENRNLNADERLAWDKIYNRSEELRSRIEVLEKQQAAEQYTEQPRSVNDLTIVRADTKEQIKIYDNPVLEYRNSEKYETAFRHYIRETKENPMDPEQRRNLQADVNSAGGYTVVPLKVANELIIAKDNLLWIRQLATKIVLDKAQSLGFPNLAADIEDADWTSELQTGTEDTEMAFSRRDLSPNPLAKRIRVSNKLIRISTFDIEGLVRRRMAVKFAVTEEKAFMTGSGVGRPLGIFVASANGIPSSRDVSAGNTTTALTFDGLINAKMSLKAQYRQSSALRWLFNRIAIKNAMLIKDANDHYIWEANIQNEGPDRILNVKVAESEYVPSTFTTGQYVGAIGDFKQYVIVESLEFTIQKLLELYAETNQTGFIGREELDGSPMIPDAFARVKLA
jgi:HK97 family phage major capsid protein